jgi:peptidoglycan/LPS O-acetylase OafA/YrhL
MMLTVKADAGFAYQGGITLWILASGAMVLYLVSDPHPLRSWIARGAEIVGKGSYAIYLWQVPVIRAVGRVGDRHAAGRRITLCLLGIAACTALSWFLVERPAQRLRRRVEARPWFSGLGAPPTLDGAVARGG